MSEEANDNTPPRTEVRAPTAPETNVLVLFFAQAAELAEVSEETLRMPATTDTAAVKSLLVQRHPALAGLLPHCRLAVDQAFAHGPITLHGHSEIAVIPPVSGG